MSECIELNDIHKYINDWVNLLLQQNRERETNNIYHFTTSNEDISIFIEKFFFPRKIIEFEKMIEGKELDFETKKKYHYIRTFLEGTRNGRFSFCNDYSNYEYNERWRNFTINSKYLYKVDEIDISNNYIISKKYLNDYELFLNNFKSNFRIKKEMNNVLSNMINNINSASNEIELTNVTDTDQNENENNFTSLFGKINLLSSVLETFDTNYFEKTVSKIILETTQNIISKSLPKIKLETTGTKPSILLINSIKKSINDELLSQYRNIIPIKNNRYCKRYIDNIVEVYMTYIENDIISLLRNEFLRRLNKRRQKIPPFVEDYSSTEKYIYDYRYFLSGEYYNPSSIDKNYAIQIINDGDM